MTTDRLTRRSILKGAAAAGAVVGAATGAGATEDDTKCHDERGRICTLRCDQPAKLPHKPFDCSCPDEPQQWATGSITLKNCSDCTRKVEIGVTEKIHTDREITRREYDDADGFLAPHVGSGQKLTLWFTGSISRLDVEPSHMNIAISQRSEYQAKSQCSQ